MNLCPFRVEPLISQLEGAAGRDVTNRTPGGHVSGGECVTHPNNFLAQLQEVGALKVNKWVAAEYRSEGHTLQGRLHLPSHEREEPPPHQTTGLCFEANMPHASFKNLAK
jgi:hypothetical protein